MSIHVHFQPLDFDLVQKRINPFLLGEGDIDDLAVESLRRKQLGSFHDRCQKKLLEAVEKSGAVLPDWYDQVMNTWYRPYFVASADPTVVAETIDRYQDAGPKQIQDIVREQVKMLAPEVVNQVKPVPLPKLTEPTPKAVAKVLEKLNYCRAALDAHQKKKPFHDLEGEKKTPLEVIARELPENLLRFNEELQPAWFIDAWYTEALFRSYGNGDLEEEFLLPRVVFEPVCKRMPRVGGNMKAKAQWNGMRGVLPTAKVAEVRTEVQRLFEEEPARDENIERSMRSLVEALIYAERRGLAFTERIS